MNPSFAHKQPYQKYDPRKKKYYRNSYLCTVEHNDDETSDIISDFHDLFIPMLELACETLEVPSARIIQGRSFLQFPLNLESEDDDTPHIDLDEGKSWISSLSL